MATRIKIIVGGRFHADQMAKALIDAGHQVSLETTLPANRFKTLSKKIICSHVMAEAMFRAASRVGFESWGDHHKMRRFGSAVAQHLGDTEVIVGWSSFSLEAFQATSHAKKILVRDSCHIQRQMEILEKEYDRWGMRFPAREFCVKRELEEYQLADQIIVLSEFAKQSFIEKGISANKLDILRLGVDLDLFEPLAEHDSTSPLKLVCFGTLGVRKGIGYLLEACSQFSHELLELHLVGPIERGFGRVLDKFPGVKLYGPMPQKDLAPFIRGMHLFCLPTVEDGFGQTLIQAMASGLVPITTPHCGAGEVIRDGKNGFIVPVAEPTRLTQVLDQLISDPDRLTGLRHHAIQSAKACTWERYQQQLLSILSRASNQQAA